MKKLLCLALILALALIPVTGVQAESETARSFTLFEGNQSSTLNESNDDIMAWQKAQEATGIDVEFVHGDDNTLTMLIASEDLPDAILQNWAAFPGGAQGALDNAVIVELSEELLAEHAPNYWAYLQKWPEIKKMVTTDAGTHYQIAGIMTWETDESKGFTPVVDRAPCYESWMGLIARKDLLDAAGLEIPVTVDDWTAALRTLKENGVTAPLSATVGNFKQSNLFAGAYGVAQGLYQDENGVAHYGPMEDAYKDYLTLLAGWYAEGLIDPDLAAVDGNSAKAKMMSGESAVTIGTGGWLGSMYDTVHEQDAQSTFYDIGVANPSLTADTQPMYGMKNYPYKQGVAVTPVCKDPSVVLDFYNYLWSDEGIVTANWGIEGQSYRFDANGLPEFDAETLEKNDWGYSASAMMMKVYMLNEAIPADMRNRLYQMTLYGTDEAVTVRKTWSNSTLPSTMPPYVVPADLSSDYATIGNDLQTYVDEMYVKFVMGLESLDNFEAFRDQLRKMGVENYLSIAQTALDNYNAR